jgi:acetyl-CoA carboxylase biotin carboxyl carrier protein
VSVERALELLPGREGEHVLLRSPEVGTFTCALPAGTLLAPLTRAGVLHSLGRRFDLVVPAGVAGRVVNAPPERVLEPVGYGTVLYELAPLEGAAPATAPISSGTEDRSLVFPAPHSGRFWQRPAPNEPPFVRAGEHVEDGQTIGLIEVMKTFTHVVYRPGGALPPRARVAQILVDDGGEVEEGGALLALEPEA